MAWRGRADALSLVLAWHDREVHRQLAPSAGVGRSLFDAIEQVRVEALGARRMAGVASNLAALLVDQRGPRDEETLLGALPLLVRERLVPTPLPAAVRGTADRWRPSVEHRAGPELAQLTALVSQQRLFGEATLRLLRALDLLPKGEGRSGDAGPAPGDRADASFDAADAETDAREHHRSPPEALAEPTRDYRVFDRAGDRIVEAASLVTSAELDELRGRLDRELTGMASIVGRLATRLQRHLQAQKLCSWELDVDEGLLDASRLARVVTDPRRGLAFKREMESSFRDTIVTLLLDNSGSMRGRPIAVAAACADVLARTLERCGVKVEILGYTTRTWKGGAPRERWLAQGRPPRPGRLNELQHVVYKSADVPWRRARKNLGVLLHEDLLKQNLDGEALEWAHQRLLVRREERRILLVISDGAPIDEATMAANGADYLEGHLREVIERIERRSSVELAAIGIGHDVTRYYHRALSLVDVEELGRGLATALASLFQRRR